LSDDDKQIPVNGEAEPGDEPAADFSNQSPTPEGAMVDLSATDGDVLLLPQSTRALYYFAYDHFMDQAHIARYVKGLIPVKIARAPHFRLSWPYFYPPDGTGLPSLERSSRDDVWGILYDAKGRDFARLEKHLNTPNRYHRRALQVLDRGDRRFTAFTYVLTVFDDTSSKPSAAYLEHLTATAKEKGLPESWQEYLAGLPMALPD
jgi:hypothetical protein